MERASYLLLNREAQVDESDVVEALYDLKQLEPTPEVVNLATKLEGIVIVYLMREWEISVENVLTDYEEKRKRTADEDFQNEIQFIALRAKALRDATVLSNPERAPNDEVNKRVKNLREVIENIANFLEA
jgi:hypothetical protein